MRTARDDAVVESAATGGAEKSGYVREIFSQIAPRYDLLNHLLSLNVDRRWRRKAVADLRIVNDPRARYLDLCAGTLDVSVAIASSREFEGLVIGADFALPMLTAGRAKIDKLRIAPVTADALTLPFASASIAGAIVAFGIRNVQDLDGALREVHRVIRPGGRFVILEFSTPPNRIVRIGYNFYFNRMLPAIGGVISGHRTAYRYLPRSVASFPTVNGLADRMRLAGFQDIKWGSLSFGIAAIHSGIASAR